MDELLTPAEIVLGFARAWDRLDLDAVIGMLAPDIVYHNIPLEPLRGRSNVETYLRAVGPFESCSWRVLNIAVEGARVLTERVDQMVVKGTPIVLPVMGIFEISNGLISAWRDYFDLAGYRAQWPSEPDA